MKENLKNLGDQNKFFHYIQWKNNEPDFVNGYFCFLDKKIEACLAYKTQFYDPTSTDNQ
jgi:hypothetical protein